MRQIYCLPSRVIGYTERKLGVSANNMLQDPTTHKDNASVLENFGWQI